MDNNWQINNKLPKVGSFFEENWVLKLSRTGQAPNFFFNVPLRLGLENTGIYHTNFPSKFCLDNIYESSNTSSGQLSIENYDVLKVETSTQTFNWFKVLPTIMYTNPLLGELHKMELLISKKFSNKSNFHYFLFILLFLRLHLRKLSTISLTHK